MPIASDADPLIIRCFGASLSNKLRWIAALSLVDTLTTISQAITLWCANISDTAPLLRQCFFYSKVFDTIAKYYSVLLRCSKGGLFLG